MNSLPFPFRHSLAIIKACQPIGLGHEDDFSLLVGALDYVFNNNIAGAVVECGVYRGGMPLAALMVMADRRQYRDVWLYDTFAGMPAPDVQIDGNQAEREAGNLAVSLDDVRANLDGYVARYVVGDVRETTLTEAPESISILRLDVDWYAGTKACLENLYPRLSKGGVLILDDYNYWQGAKLAMDEYLPDAPLVRAGTGSAMVKP